MEAVIDTGFTDRLTLPPDVVEELGLPLRGAAEVTLADGSLETLPVYRARVFWHGQERTIRAYGAPGEPLVGMALLSGSELRMQVVADGAVEIERLP
jgi:clan AA aspartic protease